MCEKPIRYWFSAKSRGHGRMVHIISARSIGRVRASMGRLSEEYLIEQLMWSDLNRLAGIAPPVVDSATTFAADGLTYEHNGRVISIEVAD